MNVIFGSIMNFSFPTRVLSSSRELGRFLTGELSKAPAGETTSTPAPDRIRIDGPSVHAILSENREALVAQNMIEKGHTRGQAEGEIDALLEVALLLAGVEIESGARDGALRLDLRVEPAPVVGGAKTTEL